MSDAIPSPAEVYAPMSRWRWAYRLLRVTAMLIAAYWLSRTGEAFFYQGF